jgi:hypothetical protein
MADSKTNFNVDQGATFTLDFQLKDADGDPVNISTAVIFGQVRKTVSSKEIAANFEVIPIDLVQGQFTLKLSAISTSKLKCNPSHTAQRQPTPFAYDVELHYSDGTVSRILEGILFVSPEVTR